MTTETAPHLHLPQHLWSTDHDVSAGAAVTIDQDKVAEDFVLDAMHMLVQAVVGMKMLNYVIGASTMEALTQTHMENQTLSQQIATVCYHGTFQHSMRHDLIVSSAIQDWVPVY